MLARLTRAAAARPDRIAVTNATHRATYSELAAQAEAFRRALVEAGGKPRVMVALPGGPEFTAIQFGCMAAGAIFVPVPSRATPDEYRKYAQVVTPDVLVASSRDGARWVEGASDPPPTLVVMKKGGDATDVSWEDVLTGRGALRRPRPRRDSLPRSTTMVQFTSGSTGTPKGILLDNANQAANLDANHGHLSAFEDRDAFCPIPQFHAMGNAVVIEHLLHGSPVHLANDMLYGEHLRRMRRHECRAILGPPNYFKLLLRAGVLTSAELPCLESVTIGTALAEQALVAQIRSAFPSLTIYCRYGVSESVGTLMRLAIPGGETLAAPGLVGTPVPGVVLAGGLVAPGEGEVAEIRVKHDANALGQLLPGRGWRRLVDDGGYLRTGDLAFLDVEGRVHLRGRLSEFIKSNGFRINPVEIEEVLLQVSGVADAVVVGIPDDLSGERVTACVELLPDASGDCRTEMVACCRTRLSPHKLPQDIIVVPSLPRTHTGKPDRRAVAALAESRRPPKE